jgi:hypothetical protein
MTIVIHRTLSTINGSRGCTVQIPLSLYREMSEKIRFLTSLHHSKLSEYWVAELVNGRVIRCYAESYDVVAPSGLRLQVKSCWLQPHVRRWSFSNVIGDYDLLILVGSRDNRFRGQYLDEAEKVYWLIERDQVPLLATRSKNINIAIKPWAPTAKRFRPFMVAEARIRQIP